MLSKRLAAVADLIPKNSIVADIGTDHAYLPIELIKNGTIKHAIASDVAQGPLNNAQSNIENFKLSDQIETRLGSGLETLTITDNVDTVVIAGMGGNLIVDLLTAAPLKFPHLILEPNVGEEAVRKWLTTNNYQIVNEKIVAEFDHTYEIIRADLTGIAPKLTANELKFGPLLLQQKDQLFVEKWRNRITFLEKLKIQISQSKQPNQAKISTIEQEIKQIEEVLQ